MTNYNSKNFDLNLNFSKNSLRLTHIIHNGMVRTNNYPLTFSILRRRLPSIFENICFNDGNKSFQKEVKNTEVGHLFEHILLEKLKIEALKRNIYGDFEGYTHWDWNATQFGQFNISIKLTNNLKVYLEDALKSSIPILEEILNSRRRAVMPA